MVPTAMLPVQRRQEILNAVRAGTSHVAELASAFGGADVLAHTRLLVGATNISGFVGSGGGGPGVSVTGATPSTSRANPCHSAVTPS